MLKLSSSSVYLFIPVSGPVTDLSQFAVSVALRLESVGGEPATADYKPATWLNGEAVLLVSQGDYPDGLYDAYVRVVAAPEDVRLFSGRVRIGDART